MILWLHTPVYTIDEWQTSCAYEIFVYDFCNNTDISFVNPFSQNIRHLLLVHEDTLMFSRNLGLRMSEGGPRIFVMISRHKFSCLFKQYGHHVYTIEIVMIKNLIWPWLHVNEKLSLISICISEKSWHVIIPILIDHGSTLLNRLIGEPVSLTHKNAMLKLWVICTLSADDLIVAINFLFLGKNRLEYKNYYWTCHQSNTKLKQIIKEIANLRIENTKLKEIIKQNRTTNVSVNLKQAQSAIYLEINSNNISKQRIDTFNNASNSDIFQESKTQSLAGLCQCSTSPIHTEFKSLKVKQLMIFWI